jgi:hypothetical protein
LLSNLRLFPALVIDRAFMPGVQACLDKEFIPLTGSSKYICDQLSSLRKLSLQHPVVVWDINPSVAGMDIEGRLLKTLEDMEIRVVLYSSADAFSQIFLSRFSVVIKSPHIVPIENNPNFDLYTLMEQENTDILTEVVSKSVCYLPYVIQSQSGYITSKAKLMGLL